MDAADVKALPARIESLLDRLSGVGDPTVTVAAEELVRALLDLYGAGLGRIADLVGESGVRQLATDDLVANLLMLHGLHPDDMDTRVQLALDRVRPYLGSHAGGIEYLGVDEDGVAHLRLEGSCDGCPSSSVTVRLTIEQAVLDAAPEVSRVQVDGMVEGGQAAPRELPLLQIGLRPPDSMWLTADAAPPTPPAGRAPSGVRPMRDPEADWQEIDLAPLPGGPVHLELAGCEVLVVAIAGTPYAYLDSCPECGSPPSQGRLDGTELACAGCGSRYDIRLAGRRVGGDGHLEPLPPLPAGSRWRIAVPVAVAG